MNICIHENCLNRMLNKDFELKKCTYAVTHHTQHSGNQQHSVMHAFIMFIISLTEKIVTKVKCTRSLILWRSLICNQLCRCNIPPNHRSACSLISQQRCHPRARHDSPRNKGTSRLTHGQGYTKHNPAITVGFIRPLRSWRRQIAKLVCLLQSQEHLHQKLAWPLRNPNTPNTRN